MIYIHVSTISFLKLNFHTLLWQRFQMEWTVPFFCEFYFIFDFPAFKSTLEAIRTGCFVFIHTSVELLIWLAQAALVRNKSGFIKSTIISPSCFLSSFQLFPIPQANHFYFCVFNLDIHLCVCV